MIDKDYKLADKVPLKNAVISISCVIKDDDKFYLQPFLEEALVAWKMVGSGKILLRNWKKLMMKNIIMMMMMMMICFCAMVDRWKRFSLISSRDHCQRPSPSRISDTLRTGFELAQGLVEWNCAVVITTIPRCHYKIGRMTIAKLFLLHVKYFVHMRNLLWNHSEKFRGNLYQTYQRPGNVISNINKSVCFFQLRTRSLWYVTIKQCKISYTLLTAAGMSVNFFFTFHMSISSN